MSEKNRKIKELKRVAKAAKGARAIRDTMVAAACAIPEQGRKGYLDKHLPKLKNAITAALGETSGSRRSSK